MMSQYFSKTLTDHEKHIHYVFERLRKQGLKLKAKKRSFVQEDTQYLSFIIDKDGIRSDPNKVAAIRTLPCPKKVREILWNH